MNLFNSVFDIVFWASLALSIIALIVAVILFFKDKIWLVIQYFTGVKSGKRMTGRVQMQTTPSASSKQPKRVWKSSGAKTEKEQVTVQLKNEPATVQLPKEPATVQLPNDPVTVQLPDTQGTAVMAGGGTEILQPGAADVLPQNVPGGTAVMGAAQADGYQAGSIAVDVAPEPEGGTVVLQDTPAAPAPAPGGTVALKGDDGADFRITERIMFVFSDEVVL